MAPDSRMDPTYAATPPALHLPLRARLDRYSRWIGMAKIVLPGTGLGILAVALLWQDIVPQAISRRVGAPIGLEALRQHEMSAPKFVGSDEKARPYQVEAKSARLAHAKSDTVILEQPKASLTLESGNWVAVTSRDGEFNQKTRIISLVGDVYVFHDANYTFRTEKATVDTEKKTAWGDRPVVATGPKGTIESKGFRIEDKGATIVFTGKTRVVLHLDDQDMKDITGEGKGAKTEKVPATTNAGE